MTTNELIKYVISEWNKLYIGGWSEANENERIGELINKLDENKLIESSTKHELIQKLIVLLDKIKGCDPDTNKILYPKNDYFIYQITQEIINHCGLKSI